MPTVSIFDLSQAIDRVDGDREVFLELAQLFIDQAPQELMAIRNSLAQHSPQEAAMAAHKLKGSVLQFCATTPYECLACLEKRAKAGEFELARSMYDAVDRQVHSLVDALRELIEKGFPS